MLTVQKTHTRKRQFTASLALLDGIVKRGLPFANSARPVSMAPCRNSAALRAMQGKPRQRWVPPCHPLVGHAAPESTQPVELVPALLAKLASLSLRPLQEPPPAQIATLEGTLPVTKELAPNVVSESSLSRAERVKVIAQSVLLARRLPLLGAPGALTVRMVRSLLEMAGVAQHAARANTLTKATRDVKTVLRERPQAAVGVIESVLTVLSGDTRRPPANSRARSAKVV